MIKPFKFFQGRPKRLYHYDLLVGGIPVEVLNSNEPQTHFFRDAQTHEFCAGVHNTQLILHYEGDMDIESVRAMTWDLTTRYTNYVSITEHVILFMENFLNEHLSGTSTIRLA